MIFLGAGASKPFGLKTMQDLTNDLVVKMKDRGHGELIDNILKSLQTFGFKPDFESVYTILECLTNPRRGVQSSGPFTAFICKDLEHVQAHPEFEEVLLDFRRVIYDICTIRPSNVENCRQLYDELFHIVEGVEEKRRLSPLAGYNGLSDIQVPIGNTVVTTNYDMSIELYHRLIRLPLADGFGITPEYFVKELNFESYYRVGDTARWLIKLHGSIWQFKQGNRIIKTIEDPTKSSVSIKVDEEIMIYPIGEKPILTNPYYGFYRLFKEQPWDTMIAIGYSFRDEPVNIAIMENLERNRNARLIVLNPEAELVANNLGIIAEKFKERIIPVSGEFGSKSSFQDLSTAIITKNLSDYIKTKKLKEISTKKHKYERLKKSHAVVVKKCPSCGTVVTKPRKTWKMAGRPGPENGKRTQLEIGLFDCPKCGKQFRAVLNKKQI